jgi:hypothetical protein
MKLNRSWQRALIGLLVFLMAVPAPVFAQNYIPVFKQEELDQILAPIALYPDSLLAQILMASTYPIEVVQADRWVRANRGLPPEALNDALDRQSWDPSVKALVPFPNILSMMSEKIDWTQQVGDAFLAQEPDVMESIQRLRERAYLAGNLRSSQQLAVSRQGGIIVIEPANPQVVYVPVYSPVVVYGRWRYPAYPPAVIYPYPPPGAVIAAGIITFGVGIAIASAWNHGWGHWDWGHRHVYVNVNRTVNINRTTTVIHKTEMRTTTWRHDPVHRKGVAYRDPRSREKFEPVNRQAVDQRRDFRGYDQRDRGPGHVGSAVARPAPETRTAPHAARPEAKPAPGVARPAPGTRPGSVVMQQPAPQTKPAPAVTKPAPETKPGPVVIQQPAPQTRPPTVTRPKPETKPGTPAVQRPPEQARPAPAVSRPAPPNTIYGVEQGNKARRESNRGRESLSSPRGKGEGPQKAAPGASKPAPAQKPAPEQGGQKRDGGGPGRK